MAQGINATQRLIAVCLCVGLLTGGVALGVFGPAACQETRPIPPNHAPIRVKGERFVMELAIDDRTRIRGLGGRESITPDGGMLFVFPDLAVRQFVMRDCLTDIDIAFLDDAGRVVATHEMKAEPIREGESGNAYEMRLTRYSSRFAARFAVEFAPGTLDRLKLQEGDVVELDARELKRQAR